MDIIRLVRCCRGQPRFQTADACSVTQLDFTLQLHALLQNVRLQLHAPLHDSRLQLHALLHKTDDLADS